MEALSVKGLCKEYPSFSLKDVSFSVEQGTIMGFIGRNGAGKTTTLKSILNLVHPSRGEIRFFGMELEKNELEIKKQIGFVPGGVDYYVKKKIKTITNVIGTSKRTAAIWRSLSWTKAKLRISFPPA